MKKQQGVRKIDFSYKRLGKMADKFYNDGKYVSALRFAYKQFRAYGGDPDVYDRLADIYENMGLHSSAIHWLYRYLDTCDEDEIPDIYESLAVNYLNMGNESQAAYYYNRLVDVDDTLPEEAKLEIAAAFSHKKSENFRFVYPPEKADYSKEMELGSKALKHGDTARAVSAFEKVVKGSKDYPQAKEMQAVALLLSERAEEAERICLALLEDDPNNVQAAATLAAAYLEQGKTDDSKAIALRLATQKQRNAEETYKVATVCCENDLHEEAYLKFCELEKDMPYDGRMLYFKGVAAYKSGRKQAAIESFDKLYTIYPDAAVVDYYLKRLRENTDGEDEPELTYFYRLPKEERECRKSMLEHVEKLPVGEAELLGTLAFREGYFHWCFDEMDGTDQELQYLALKAAARANVDELIEEALLDTEVSDFLKIETLRLLLERNLDDNFGLVLCHIYKRLDINRISIGKKCRKRFIEGYAKLASKFIAIQDGYPRKIKYAAEKLYRAVESADRFDLLENSDDIACALYFAAGLRELGQDVDSVSAAFDGEAATVRALIACLRGANETHKGLERIRSGEKTNETH